LNTDSPRSLVFRSSDSLVLSFPLELTNHVPQRVVVQALIYAAHEQKKRFQVYVTESRPFGLGIKTQAILAKAGIPTQVILDSAVAYIMPKVDLAMVGAEAVCESGGLINFVSIYLSCLS